jgi:D-arabinose 1-dehydrogenase-like Zn-dependent alcohol dehydrogenase
VQALILSVNLPMFLVFQVNEAFERVKSGKARFRVVLETDM